MIGGGGFVAARAYEMRIRDPDGHMPRIGSESLPGTPVND